MGALWAGALLGAFWNHQAIDAILSIQAQNQALRRELIFQQQNARRLARIQEEHAQLFISAESLQLGMLTAKSILSELASRLELAIRQITLATPQKGAETLSLSLSFSGSIEKIVHFLSSLAPHRFLHPKQITLKFDPKNGTGSCELSLLLRCRIHPAARNESPPNAPVARSAL
jgi:hypothetical protein